MTLLELNTINAQLDSINSILDNGNTGFLLNEINTCQDSVMLTQTLVLNSPLSDTVISELISIYPVNNDQFIEIMTLNMPVSDQVDPLMKNKLSKLPQPVQDSLLPLQAYNPNHITAEAIRRNLQSTTSLSQIIDGDIRFAYLDTGDTLAYLNHLTSYNNPYHQKLLLGHYLEQDSLTSARSILNNYSIESEIDSLWVEYMDILVSLKEDGKTLYEISRSDLMFIEAMANDCSKGIVNAHSRNLLSMLYDREFEPCDYLPPSTRSLETEMVEGSGACSIGNVFPNPCTSEVFLPVHCKDASEIEIRILDITGRMLQSEIRELEGGICKINTQKLVPGAYQVCVIFNDGSQKSRKFVKQN